MKSGRKYSGNNTHKTAPEIVKLQAKFLRQHFEIAFENYPIRIYAGILWLH
jgi:hypothetical protein